MLLHARRGSKPARMFARRNIIMGAPSFSPYLPFEISYSRSFRTQQKARE
jgi:hypothetical protein